ncbi:hypothetical protein F2Q68_00021292 [Brassica cretica]|uniref:Uncharacterized protein n=1 Tax=Brassica cretica TaxID=69181 RepID=A0A8S9FV57_BRACR|nr:hypothetical protein F2Q68_00021292 [Brassica cretica]
MAQDDAIFGAPGGEPTPTPEAAPPITVDFMSSIMARLAHQDEVQKMTNDQLAALVAALTAPDGQTSRPQQIRRRHFNTNPTATGGDYVADDSKPNETLLADNPPATTVAGSAVGPSRTIDPTKHSKYHDVKGHDTTECKSLYANYLSSLASGDFKFEPLKAKPKNSKSWSRNKERRAQHKAIGKGRHGETQQRDDEEDAPRGSGEGDSSADEKQPTNRRRIEVIFSQQTSSSDDENDDTPALEDLRDVLKRKFESEVSNSFKHNDLQTALDARKSRRISTNDTDPKERPNTDLRDKLNAAN